MRLVELVAPEGCTPAAELTHEERVHLLKRAGVEFACYLEGDYLTDGAVRMGWHTQFPVLIQDLPGVGYVVAEKRPIYSWPKEEGGV